MKNSRAKIGHYYIFLLLKVSTKLIQAIWSIVKICKLFGHFDWNFNKTVLDCI